MSHPAFAPITAPPMQRKPVGTELAAVETTPMPRYWLRRCEGKDPGQKVSYVDAVWQSQQPDVNGTLTDGLWWIAGSTQDPTRPQRRFTLTPMTDEQAAAWEPTHAQTIV